MDPPTVTTPVHCDHAADHQVESLVATCRHSGELQGIRPAERIGENDDTRTAEQIARHAAVLALEYNRIDHGFDFCL